MYAWIGGEIDHDELDRGVRPARQPRRTGSTAWDGSRRDHAPAQEPHQPADRPVRGRGDARRPARRIPRASWRGSARTSSCRARSQAEIAVLKGIVAAFVMATTPAGPSTCSSAAAAPSWPMPSGRPAAPRPGVLARTGRRRTTTRRASASSSTRSPASPTSPRSRWHARLTADRGRRGCPPRSSSSSRGSCSPAAGRCSCSSPHPPVAARRRPAQRLRGRPAGPPARHAPLRLRRRGGERGPRPRVARSVGRAPPGRDARRTAFGYEPAIPTCSRSRRRSTTRPCGSPRRSGPHHPPHRRWRSTASRDAPRRCVAASDGPAPGRAPTVSRCRSRLAFDADTRRRPRAVAATTPARRSRCAHARASAERARPVPLVPSVPHRARVRRIASAGAPPRRARCGAAARDLPRRPRGSALLLAATSGEACCSGCAGVRTPRSTSMPRARDCTVFRSARRSHRRSEAAANLESAAWQAGSVEAMSTRSAPHRHRRRRRRPGRAQDRGRRLAEGPLPLPRRAQPQLQRPARGRPLPLLRLRRRRRRHQLPAEARPPLLRGRGGAPRGAHQLHAHYEDGGRSRTRQPRPPAGGEPAAASLRRAAADPGRGAGPRFLRERGFDGQRPRASASAGRRSRGTR